MDSAKVRFRLVSTVVAVVALTAVPVASAGQTGKGQAGCDASRPGLSYGLGGSNPATSKAVPCLTYTFPDFGEAGIVVTPPALLDNGATAPSAVMHGASYTQRALTEFAYRPPDMGLARSVDEGAHWQNVKFPPNPYENNYRCESDNGFFRDPNTNRVFFYGDGGCSPSAGTMNIDFTDDNGETWVDNPGDVMQFFPVSDATVMFGGPPRASDDAAALNKVGYSDVTYLCGGGKCFKSLDGGIVFSEIMNPQTQTDDAGGNGAVMAGPDGTLYGGHMRSGGTMGGSVSTQLTYSTDDGTTWKPFAGTFPTGFAPACARPSDYGNLSIDKDGNIYLGGTIADAQGNRQLAVTYLKTGTSAWSAPVPLQMPGITNVDTGIGLCAFDSDWDRPGHVAAAYMATNPSDNNVEQHGYLTETDNLFAKTPLFTSVQVDSKDKPLFPEGAPCNVLHESVPPCTPHSASRLDYISVTFSPVDGSPWAVYAKDACTAPACPDQADPNDPQGTFNHSREYFWTNFLGAVGTMAS